MALLKNILKQTAEKDKHQFERVVSDFPDLNENIKYLIRYRSNKYVIFIDQEKDFDWETDDCMDDIISSSDANIVLCEIEYLQHQPCVRYFTYHQKVELYCLLGGALAYVLENDYNVAKTLLDKAREYIDARKYEITRKWQLSYSLIIMGISILIFLFLAKYFGNMCDFFGFEKKGATNLLFCFWGIVGAVFSIMQNMGNTFYDCQSGRLLNFLQIFSKITAGMISSIFVIYLHEMGLIFSSMSGENRNACLTVMCIVSGFSERLVPSVIHKICEDETKEEKNG